MTAMVSSETALTVRSPDAQVSALRGLVSSQAGFYPLRMTLLFLPP